MLNFIGNNIFLKKNVVIKLKKRKFRFAFLKIL